MVSIAAAFQRIKEGPRAVIQPSVVESVCRELGLEWRNTPLTPPATIALLARQVPGVFPNHQKRLVSFRPHRSHNRPGKSCCAGQPTSRWIKRLGKEDQRVEYFKPVSRPRWMSRRQYHAMPASIGVREIRRKVYKSGFRPRVIGVVTTWRRNSGLLR